METRFDHKNREPALYKAWENSHTFACGSAKGKPYVIMMPPPNVTGSLHIGHALTMTIQDILTRWHRGLGKDVLWQPGTDHAGIATQMMVERELDKQGQSRHTLGREKFLEQVWQWKEKSESQILEQLRALGASPDWQRLRFTLDPALSKAVTRVFVNLYREKLLYRAKRPVNWDPVLRTAVSDLEVQQRSVAGTMWSLRYPIIGADKEFVTVATTRPETFFGDVAVAVHPADERNAHLIGKQLRLPIVEREIPVIADEMVNAEMGSGCVKVTPAHSFDDFECGERHGLPAPDIFDDQAQLNDSVPEAFRGLSREEARTAVVAAFAEQNLLGGEQSVMHVVPHGDRSGAALEPRLTDQWFCDVEPLAQRAISAVESGEVRFVPERWSKTYYEWMHKIRPWCISRQLWWGHRIPAWYGPDGTLFVEETADQAHATAAKHYGKQVELEQDEDVLDTWFSSGLWPFSTLGWGDLDDSASPAERETIQQDLARYYPGAVLVTGFDIIFFWVARMIMMGLHTMEAAPFREVYIHALVRDAKGQKMSKTKGNVIDPLELIDRYGSDAVRFTLASMATPGRDVNLDPKRVEGYRNFTTKLWNAARFAHLRGVSQANLQDLPDIAKLNEPHNLWMVSRLADLGPSLARAYETYRFDSAAAELYEFVWHEVCDWYLELAKSAFATSDTESATDSASAIETRAVLALVLDFSLKYLHPMIPFISEEIWRHFCTPSEASPREQTGEPDLLAAQAWPDPLVAPPTSKATEAMAWYMELVREVRVRRAELRVPQSAKLQLFLGAGALDASLLGTSRTGILRLAGLAEMTPLEDVATDEIATNGIHANRIQWSQGGIEVHLLLGEAINLGAEKQRLAGAIASLEKQYKKLSEQLADEQFLQKASKDAVDIKRAKSQTLAVDLERTKAILSRLGVSLEP